MQILLVGVLFYCCVLSVNSDWAFNPNYERSQLVGFLIEDEDSTSSPLRYGRSNSGWGWNRPYNYIGYPKGYFRENGHLGGWDTYPYNYHLNFGKGGHSGWNSKPLLPPTQGWKEILDEPYTWDDDGYDHGHNSWGWKPKKGKIKIKAGYSKIKMKKIFSGLLWDNDDSDEWDDFDDW